MKPIGLLGGTFDPVHNGHLRLALEVREYLDLSEVRLLPAPSPRLREAPERALSTRLQLLHTAVDDIEGLRIDEREAQQSGPTRSIETLASFRSEFPQRSLCLILGADIAERLEHWHDWQRLADYAHLIFARRPGSDLPKTGPVHEFIQQRLNNSLEQLHTQSAGLVMVCDIPGLDIAARDIRARLAAGRSIDFLVPEKVKQMLLNEAPNTHG